MDDWTAKELDEDVMVKFVFRVCHKNDGAMRMSACDVFLDGCESEKELRLYVVNQSVHARNMYNKRLIKPLLMVRVGPGQIPNMVVTGPNR